MRELSDSESELLDLLKTILEQIKPYYPSSKTKTIPSETACKIRKLAEKLRNYAGDFKEHVSLEILTDEMRTLADDLANMDYADTFICGRAVHLSAICITLWSDLVDETEYIPKHKPATRTLGKRILTDDESKAASYFQQAHDILQNIASKRSWSANCPDRLRYYADQLDRCPSVRQYRDFLNVLKPVNDKPATDLPAKKPAETERKAKSIVVPIFISTTAQIGLKKLSC